MSDWKGVDHWNIHINSDVLSRISWYKKQGLTTYKIVHAWGLWMWERDVAENPNHEKRTWLKTTWVNLAGALITKESQRLCGKYQVTLILLIHNRSWLTIADVENPSSQYVYFGLLLAWTCSLQTWFETAGRTATPAMFVFWTVGPLMSYIMLFIHLTLLLIFVLV